MNVTTEQPNKPFAREINETLRYTCWAVFSRTRIEPAKGTAAELEAVIASFDNVTPGPIRVLGKSRRTARERGLTLTYAYFLTDIVHKI